MHDGAGEPTASVPARRGPAPDAASVIAFGTAPPGAVRDGPATEQAGPRWHRGPLPEIPGYAIRSMVGVGGLGVVFDAQQSHPQRRVAIKLVRPELVADDRLRDSVLRRFESEVAHASRLHHPYILPVYDAGFFGEADRRQPYLAMEFLDAPSLLEFARARDLDRPARLELLAKIAEGVHYAHLNGVVHRDLKPSNIVVRESGLPAIRDFSLAWSRPQELAGRERLTEPGSVVCTFDYAAPEQLDATAEVGPSVDLYALGVIAYELLLGRLPYEVDRSDLGGLVRAIAEGRQRWDGTAMATLGPDLAAVLRHAIEPRTGDRYVSAERFAEDLRRVNRQERPSVRRATAFDDLRRVARRHRAATAVAALLLVAVAAGTTTTLWQARVASAHAARAEARSDRLGAFAEQVVSELVGMAELMPSGTAPRSQLLDEGVRTLESIASERNDDPDITETLANALVQLAQVAGDPSRSNVGDMERAARSARRAIELYESIPGYATEIRLRSRVASTQLVLAKILASSDDEGSLAAVWAASREFLAILAADPTEGNARAMSGYSLRIAAMIDLESQRERLQATLTETWAALDRALSMAPAPTREQALADSDSYESLASAATSLGRLDEARSLLAAAEAAIRPHADLGIPDALGRLANLGRAYARLCQLGGDREGEWARRTQVRDDFAALVERFPDNVRLLTSHVWVAYETAECAVRLDIDADAETKRSVELRRAWFERDRANESARVALEKSLSLRRSWLGDRSPEEAAAIDRELAALRPSAGP